MIIPTLTEKERDDEIMKDMPYVLRFSDSKDSKFRRLVLKSVLFPVYAKCYYTSPLKNRWLICFEARNKKEIGDYCRMTTVCISKDMNGMPVAFMPTSTNGKYHIISYPHHLFSRYKERINAKESGEKLIERFFRYNYSYVFDISEKPLLGSNVYYNEIYGSSKDGAALGILTSEGNIFFKTFITYEMTKGEQIKKFAENENIRKEIHEKE